MNFKMLSKMNVGASFISMFLGVSCALYGLGLYSLVIAGYGSTIFMTVILATVVRWHPRMPRIRPVGKFIPYAMSTYLSRIQDTAAERVDNMIVGALAGMGKLGIYNRAYSLAHMPVDNLVGTLGSLLVSGFSRSQDDVSSSVRMYRIILCGIACALGIIVAILFWTAEDIIPFVYGVKWLPAAEPMKLMIIGACAMMVSVTLRSLIAAQDLVAREVAVHFVSVVATVIVAASMSRYGIEYVAGGIALREFIVMFLLFRILARSRVSLQATDIMTSCVPAIMAAAVGSIAWLSVQAAPGVAEAACGIRVAVGIGVISSSYIATILLLTLLWQSNTELHHVVRQGKSLMKESVRRVFAAVRPCEIS